jgi:protease I
MGSIHHIFSLSRGTACPRRRAGNPAWSRPQTDTGSGHDEEATTEEEHDEGDTFEVDLTVAEADPDSFGALVLPGGVANPDALRTDKGAVDLVRALVSSGKPVAAICHAAWSLVEADVVRGRTLTSWPSLQTDVRNAGGTWVDEEVVVDRNLVTSRKPDDLPAFNAALLEILG